MISPIVTTTKSGLPMSPASALVENPSDLDLGFYLYYQMALLTSPDCTILEATKHWNAEDPMNRSALKQVAYAVGEEAVRRRMS